MVILKGFWHGNFKIKGMQLTQVRPLNRRKKKDPLPRKAGVFKTPSPRERLPFRSKIVAAHFSDHSPHYTITRDPKSRQILFVQPLFKAKVNDPL